MTLGKKQLEEMNKVPIDHHLKDGTPVRMKYSPAPDVPIHEVRWGKERREEFLDALYDIMPRMYSNLHKRFDGDGSKMIGFFQQTDPISFRMVQNAAGQERYEV